MTQKKTTKKTSSASSSSAGSNTKKIAAEVGLGLAAAAAAATGAYLLTGKQGAKNRKMLKSWATKAEKEVKKQFKSAKEMNQTAYDTLVEKVVKGYKELKNVDQSELVGMVKELKGHWKTIQRDLAKVKKTVVSHKKAPAKAKKK